MMEHELHFAPGEGELLFYSLGFSLNELRDDIYVGKALNAIGGPHELEKVQTDRKSVV